VSRIRPAILSAYHSLLYLYMIRVTIVVMNKKGVSFREPGNNITASRQVTSYMRWWVETFVVSCCALILEKGRIRVSRSTPRKVSSR
jgi:hypothetical protein